MAVGGPAVLVLPEHPSGDDREMWRPSLVRVVVGRPAPCRVLALPCAGSADGVLMETRITQVRCPGRPGWVSRRRGGNSNIGDLVRIAGRHEGVLAVIHGLPRVAETLSPACRCGLRETCSDLRVTLVDPWKRTSCEIEAGHGDRCTGQVKKLEWVEVLSSGDLLSNGDRV